MTVGSSWPVAVGTVRQVRWRVLVGGQPLAGCESVQVHTNNHYAADTFSGRFSLTADPAQASVWADKDPPILLEVQAAFLQDGAAPAWQSAFTGEVDRLDIDLVSATVDVEGRDLSRRLIDAKTKETFANQRVSDIVSTLAGRHGLTADCGAFPEMAGSFYQLEHDKITNDSFGRTTTEHDLLVYLAKHVGADYWVSGTVLHFKTAVDDSTATPLQLTWAPRGAQAYPGIQVTDIKQSRNLTLAKDIKVVMRIWNSKGKSASEVTYPPGAKKTAQEIVLTPRQFASPAAALTYVQSQYADIVKHERVLQLTMPGELSMDARSIIALTGTGTSFDQRYFVDTIERSWSVDEGFRQSVHVKNRETQSEAQVG